MCVCGLYDQITCAMLGASLQSLNDANKHSLLQMMANFRYLTDTDYYDRHTYYFTDLPINAIM